MDNSGLKERTEKFIKSWNESKYKSMNKEGRKEGKRKKDEGKEFKYIQNRGVGSKTRKSDVRGRRRRT